MIKENIPAKLHKLIPLVEKWGIEDDGFRDELIYSSSREDLKSLTDTITDDILEILNDWLADENEIEKSTDEYIKFTCFYMAYEYASSIIQG